MIDLKDYITEGLFDNKLLKPLRDFIQRNFKKRVGFKEMVTIGIKGDKYEFTATIDTGNGGVVPTLGVDKMNIDNDKVTITIGDKEYTFDKKGEASPTVGNVVHHRPIIIIDYIKIGGRKLDEPFIAVTDERKKSTKTLINRDTMTKLNLVVDPSKNNLIREKLHLDNIKKEESKYCSIYNVHEGDKVLAICSSKKSNASIKYVTLFPAEIEEIVNDKIIVKSLKSGRVISEIEYDFENPAHSSAKIPNTFAFYRDERGKGWSALMQLHKAEDVFDSIKNGDLHIISVFRFDSGDLKKKDALAEIQKYLKD